MVTLGTTDNKDIDRYNFGSANIQCHISQNQVCSNITIAAGSKFESHIARKSKFYIEILLNDWLQNPLTTMINCPKSYGCLRLEMSGIYYHVLSNATNIICFRVKIMLKTTFFQSDEAAISSTDTTSFQGGEEPLLIKKGVNFQGQTKG